MASTEERVRSIVVDLLGVDEDRLIPGARFREDLEADSLDLVELIMAFEEEFGGEISDEDAQKITSVGEAVKDIDSHLKKERRPSPSTSPGPRPPSGPVVLWATSVVGQEAGAAAAPSVLQQL